MLPKHQVKASVIILPVVFHVQALVSLAEEISQAGIPEGSRKINGRYIQSHLHSRLEGNGSPLSYFRPTEFFILI